jgi:hypothetical protein
MSDKGSNDLHRFAALQLSITYSTVLVNVGKVGTDPRRGLLFIGPLDPYMYKWEVFSDLSFLRAWQDVSEHTRI